ncbi:MAG TPA: hypothetical protein GX497_12700 [Bacillus bacterium]|nr:hypothetical protein [Bacillus sp. (in: firmicutes)]
MNPTIKDQLKDLTKQHPELATKNKKKSHKKPQKAQEEHLTEREWKDIMGVNRPIYSKHKGAWRQR